MAPIGAHGVERGRFLDIAGRGGAPANEGAGAGAAECPAPPSVLPRAPRRLGRLPSMRRLSIPVLAALIAQLLVARVAVVESGAGRPWTEAETGTGIYGVNLGASGMPQVLGLDALTGDATHVADLPLPDAGEATFGIAAFDPPTQTYYSIAMVETGLAPPAAEEAAELVVLRLRTGERRTVPLGQHQIMSMHFDSLHNRLLAVTQPHPPDGAWFATIDTTTGAVALRVPLRACPVAPGIPASLPEARRSLSRSLRPPPGILAPLLEAWCFVCGIFGRAQGSLRHGLGVASFLLGVLGPLATIAHGHGGGVGS